MKIGVLFKENIKVSIQSIKSNLLRTILTVMIIAIGIMALIGILTAIESIKSSISSEFSAMGASSFTIRSRGMRVNMNGKRYRQKNHSYISYNQALEFKEQYNFPATVCAFTRASGTSVAKYLSNKTNPNISVIGTDENYLITNGLELEKGRNFGASEIIGNKPMAIIGSDVVKKLFNSTNEDPIDKIISVGSTKYKVIGVLKDKGTSFGGGYNRSVILPMTNVRQYFSYPKMSYNITILPTNPLLVEAAVSEAEGTFRIVRGLKAKDMTDFNILKSDRIAKMLIENLSTVTIGATIIGIITLFGAAIGLMNIMLVSVTERTREIGTRKALGARNKIIKQQFLFEAVFIGQIGGLLGIFLGILIGNVIAIFTEGAFVIPWGWMIMGFTLTFFVGIISGYMPAVKASKLDPIESLRYE